MSTWSPPAFIDRLKVLLLADPTLDGFDPEVAVFTHWPSKSVKTTADAIILHSVRTGGLLESAAFGDNNRSKDDRYTIEGQVEVLRPVDGDPELICKDARDRAAAILDRLADVVNKRPQAAGFQTLVTTLGDLGMTQQPGLVGSNQPVRVCVIGFGIEVKARVQTVTP